MLRTYCIRYSTTQYIGDMETYYKYITYADRMYEKKTENSEITNDDDYYFSSCSFLSSQNLKYTRRRIT